MRKIAPALALALLVMLPGISLAQETSTTVTNSTESTNKINRQQMRLGRTDQKTQLTAQRETLKQDRDKLQQDRCDRTNQRITDRLSNFQSKQNSDSTIFGNAFGRLSNIQIRLKNAGQDTTTLETHLKVLQGLIDKVNGDYKEFIDKLKLTQDSTCGHSQGEFMGKLKGAQGILLSVRADRLEVRKYITSTIIPDIKALRKQLQSKEKTPSTDSATSPIAPN